jgi:phosphatidylglycerophosphate synthase
MITMRSADLATFIRVGIILLVAYLVLIGFNPFVSVGLFAIALILDGADGYMAVLEASNGKLTLGKYIQGLTGNAKLKAAIKEAKLKAGKIAPYGARLDIIGDRITEYTFWILFTYLHVIPLFVFLIVIIRNCSADGLMGLKGTSAKMKTAFARIMYASAPSRAAANVLKFLTFGYLMLEYVGGYPVIIGQALVAILVIFMVVRGASEIYESLQN